MLHLPTKQTGIILIIMTVMIGTKFYVKTVITLPSSFAYVTNDNIYPYNCLSNNVKTHVRTHTEIYTLNFINSVSTITTDLVNGR